MAKQTFTTGQVLTAAQMTSLQQTAMGGGSATAKTASYTLVAADAGTTVIMNSASATTITVNTSLFSAGDTVFIQNIGVGVCTITPGTATVNTASSLALAQYESGNLYFTAASASIFSKADGAAASGSSFVGCIATRTSSTQSISSATATAITLPTEQIDTNTFHDTSTNTSRFTIPSGKDGLYLIQALAEFNQSAGTYAYFEVFLNGSVYTSNGYNDGRFAYGPSGSNQLYGSTIMDLDATNYLEIALLSQAGCDISKARISISYLGA